MKQAAKLSHADCGDLESNQETPTVDQEVVKISDYPNQNQENFRQESGHKETLTACLGPVPTFFTIFKGLVGIGILYLPKGFTYSGWLTSSIAMLVAGIFTMEGISRQIIAHQKAGGSYSHLAEKAGGLPLRIFLEVCLVVVQITYVTGYIIFIVVNLHKISISTGYEIPEWSIGIALAIILIPLVAVRDISIFASCHIVADVIVIGASLFIIIYSLTSLANDGLGPEIASSKSFISVMRVVGIGIGSYELNAVLIPIYNQAEPRAKKSFINLQNSALITVIVLYLAVGLFCYLAYGSDSSGPITITLNQSKWYIKLLELFYMVALLLTIMLQLYPAIEIILRYTSNNIKSPTGSIVTQMAIRMTIMILCIILAVVFGEDFDLVLSIVGNVCCVPLSCLIPAILHYKLAADTLLDKIRDIVLLCFGVLCMVCIFVVLFIDYA